MNNLDKQDKDNMLPSLASLAEFAQSSTVGFRDNAVEILKLAKDQVLFGMSIQSVSKVRCSTGFSLLIRCLAGKRRR